MIVVGHTDINFHHMMWPHIMRVDKWCRRPNNLGYELVITGGTEFLHSELSRHYLGTDFDMRTKERWNGGPQIKGERRKNLFQRLKRFLGTDWFVLDEGTHFHVSYRPRRSNHEI